MPRGDKLGYTSKQQRQAHHIEEGYERRGLGSKESSRRAWATENKISGGGKRRKSSSRNSSRSSSSRSSFR